LEILTVLFVWFIRIYAHVTGLSSKCMLLLFLEIGLYGKLI
jgi:hypothetical protein